MMNYKKRSKEGKTQAYLTIRLGNRKIQTEVTVLGEKDNKAVITTDYKRTALVDKWLLMDKENYDHEKQMLVGNQRGDAVVDQMYLNLIYKNGVCLQPL